MLYRIFLLILIIKSVLSFDCQNNELMTKKDTNWMSNQLYMWCIEDKTCSELYHQDNIKNITVFKYILGNSIKGFNNLEQLGSEVLCQSVIFDSLSSKENIFFIFRN